VFEVINGAQSGYISVDDITFNDCADSAGQSCGTGRFTCGSGECLYMDEVLWWLLWFQR